MTENKKNILIIGNGPSTKQLIGKFEKLKNFDTFGLSLAYRYYSTIDWWPNYYAIADSKVVLNLKDELSKYLSSSKISESKIYIAGNINNLKYTKINHSSTGTFAINQAIKLGYKNIYLIGIEANYIEKLKESRPLSIKEFFNKGYFKLDLSWRRKRKIRIISQKIEENPNYFFDSYQRVGDIYSYPNSLSHKLFIDKIFKENQNINFFDFNNNSNFNINKLNFDNYI